MLTALLAQFGVPGGPELLIILLVLLLLGVPVVAVAAAAVLLFRGRSDRDERIAELEAEVERLRDRLDDEE
ncbi:preprotein translocase subunit TatA [Halorubrum rubrum]|uniref:Preprotein translocase subunit TatA n=1 Tax=Halorubrum rubrum TaxID=1126240 RepID=A0ABD5R4K9_9EURY|nr:preprotein translocase subunit TatA [Halorubrum rubrum]